MLCGLDEGTHHVSHHADRLDICGTYGGSHFIICGCAGSRCEVTVSLPLILIFRALGDGGDGCGIAINDGPPARYEVGWPTLIRTHQVAALR